MKFFISRQIRWEDGQKSVEIVTRGSDYSNPGALVPAFPRLGEGQEFTDPREAAEAAIQIRHAWASDLEYSLDEIDLTFGATGGFTMDLDVYSEEDLTSKAEELYQKLPKCEQCGDLLDKDRYVSIHLPDDYEFCSANCADEYVAKEQEEFEKQEKDEQGTSETD